MWLGRRIEERGEEGTLQIEVNDFFLQDKNSEEFSALRIALDGKIDALELQFEQANKTYVEGTAQQTVRFKQLTEQDLQNAKTIEINSRKLQRLQDSLNHWRYWAFFFSSLSFFLLAPVLFWFLLPLVP